MKILYDNLITDATISSFSENPYYLFDTALKDSRLSRVGRTLDDSTQWLKFDLLTAQTVTDVLINAHNFTTGATIVLEGNSTDAWTTPAVSETLTSETVIYKNFTGGAYRYWRITINDASNPDTYLEVGSVFLGTALTMPGFSPDGSLFDKTDDTYATSLSRQLYGQTVCTYKTAEIDFPCFTYAQKLLIDAFLDAVSVTDPFYLLLWEDDLDIEPPVYMHLDERPEIVKISDYGLNYSMTMKVSEVF